MQFDCLWYTSVEKEESQNTRREMWSWTSWKSPSCVCVSSQASASLPWTAQEQPQERDSNYSRRHRLSGRAADDASGPLTRPLPPPTLHPSPCSPRPPPCIRPAPAHGHRHQAVGGCAVRSVTPRALTPDAALPTSPRLEEVIFPALSNSKVLRVPCDQWRPAGDKLVHWFLKCSFTGSCLTGLFVNEGQQNLKLYLYICINLLCVNQKQKKTWNGIFSKLFWIRFIKLLLFVWGLRSPWLSTMK